MIGSRFGYLTVIADGGSYKGGGKIYECLCECGSVCKKRASYLRAGQTKSCGCKRSYLISKKATTHGQRSTGAYKSWNAMKQRCENPKNPAYKNYGAKGILFCKKWNEFVGFLDDMGERPVGTTLDRIDNSKGYFKENCRWATKVVQSRNREITKKITTGVNITKSGKYEARVSYMGKYYHLGTFDSIEGAQIARNEKKRYFYSKEGQA